MGQKEPEIKPKYIEGASSEIAENRLRLLKTLDILRDETDENNPKTQAQLRKIINKTVYCSPSTMRKILKDIRTYLEDENRSLEVKKSQHRGRLRYRDDDFLEPIGPDELEYGDNRTGYYFEHEFTEREIQLLLESILFSKNLTSEETNILLEKVSRQCGVNFQNRFKRREDYLCRMTNIVYANRVHDVQKNLELIYEALEVDSDAKCKIQFHWNGYNYKNELVPISGVGLLLRHFTLHLSMESII